MKVNIAATVNLCLICIICPALLFLPGETGAALDPFAPEKSTQILSSEADSAITFTIGAGVGYLTGESSEMVYWPESGNHKASELTWEIDDLYLFGINGEIDFHGWFTVKLDSWFKVTDGEGTMDDYDWQVVGGDWTDWSHHENTDVTDAYIFDLSGEIPFFQTQNGGLSVILGYKADKFGWEARGGEYTYSVNGLRDRQGSFSDSQVGISYEQTFSSPYIGIGAELRVEKFMIEGRFIYAPYVYGEATDNHYLRNLVIEETYDDYGEGDMVALDLTGVYNFNKNWSLGVGLKYQSYSTMTGDATWYDKSDGSAYHAGGGVGMDQTSTMFTTIVKYRF